MESRLAFRLLLLPPLLLSRPACAFGLEPLAKRAPARPLIYLNTSEGAALLQAASHTQPFWQVAARLQTELPGQCGPTTAAVLLNALEPQGLRAPVAKEYSFQGYGINMTTHYWEQHNVINASACSRKVYAAWQGALEQVAALIECAGPQAKAVRCENVDVATFRQDLVAACAASPLRYVAVNFDRRVLGQEGVGHHSPVGAYDASTDRVLVMDVARYKYPPAWVGLEELFRAMTGGAGPFGTPRGYLVVRMPQAPAGSTLLQGHQAEAEAAHGAADADDAHGPRLMLRRPAVMA